MSHVRRSAWEETSTPLRRTPESALFRLVSCRPLHCENIEPLWLLRKRRRIQNVLVVLVGPGALISASLTCCSDADTCSGAALLPRCAPRCFTPSTTPSSPRRLGTLCSGGMGSAARAPWNQGCSPVFPTTCIKRRLHRRVLSWVSWILWLSMRGSFPALFVCLRVYCSISLAKRTRVLLPPHLGTSSRTSPTSDSRGRRNKFRVSVRAFGDLGQAQAKRITAQHNL